MFVDPLGDNDTVDIGDLFTTDVASVTANAAGGDELINIAGRSVADDLALSVADNTVSVEGLSFDVSILDPTADDTLEVASGNGDDSVVVNAGVEAILTTSLLGGAGNDSLIGNFNSADGGAGDDLLHGGSNDNELMGGPGNDTLIGGDGDDTIDGGENLDGTEDFDTILISGTGGNDIIDAFQAAPDQLQHTVNGDLQVDELVPGSVEEARIVAGAGADLVRVNWLDAHGVNGPIDALRMTVEGGAGATGDRLVVVDDGDDDLLLYRQGVSSDSGTVQVGPGNAEPLLADLRWHRDDQFCRRSGCGDRERSQRPSAGRFQERSV